MQKFYVASVFAIRYQAYHVLNNSLNLLQENLLL